MIVNQIRNVSVSPQKNKIAFTALNKLYVMDRETSEMQRLTNFEDETTEAMPAWSPDGKEIAFVTWSDKNGGAIFKVRSDGKRKPILLTQQNNIRSTGVYMNPVWNYSGDRIVYNGR